MFGHLLADWRAPRNIHLEQRWSRRALVLYARSSD